MAYPRWLGRIPFVGMSRGACACEYGGHLPCECVPCVQLVDGAICASSHESCALFSGDACGTDDDLAAEPRGAQLRHEVRASHERATEGGVVEVIVNENHLSGEVRG